MIPHRNFATLLLLLAYTPTLSSAFSFNFISKPPDQKPISPIPAPISGIDLPPIGLGLWNSHNDSATHAVESALRTGYVHFDSASQYFNEKDVGAGLASSNLSRSEIWITSKLWNTHHRPSLVKEALTKTLHDLNTTHLDLYLMHWPVAFVPNTAPGRTIIDQDTSLTDTWTAMEELVRTNLTRYIGVSNFSPRQLDEVLGKCDIRPFAHEFETHPYLQQQQFVEWHADRGMQVIAYSPLANVNPTYNGTHSELGSILEDKFWVKMAERKNCTAAQAVLAWGRQRGTSVIPKSTHERHIEENLGSLDVEFSEKEMAMVAEQDKRARFNDPSKSWGVELFEGLDGGPNRFLVENKGELR